MVKEVIKPKHKKYLACPCCGKSMKIRFNFGGRDIYIEPIHAFKCSICGEESNHTKEIHHEKYDKDNPTKNVVLACASCHDHFNFEVPHIKRRQSKPFSDFVKNKLKEMKLD